MQSGLRFGPIGNHAIHLCVDMQNLFDTPSPWAMPWFKRVVPVIAQVASQHPTETCFTRFIPPMTAQEVKGSWRRFYEKWPEMTMANINPKLIELSPVLQIFTPPAAIFDKHTYSPWIEKNLYQYLQERNINTLVITGGETDMCVAITVMGAIDYGYRVILVKDALCSASDETHDAMLDIYCNRYGQQIEITEAEDLTTAWP